MEDRQSDLTPDSFKFVAFGLYYGTIFVNAVRGRRYGVTNGDINILHEIIPLLFFDRSAARSNIFIVQALAGISKGVNPSFSYYKFRSAAQPKLRADVDLKVPPDSMDDYEVPDVTSVQAAMGDKIAEVIDLMP